MTRGSLTEILCCSAEHDSNALLLDPAQPASTAEAGEAVQAPVSKKLSKAEQHKLKQVEAARERRQQLSQVCACSCLQVCLRDAVTGLKPRCTAAFKALQPIPARLPP